MTPAVIKRGHTSQQPMTMNVGDLCGEAGQTNGVCHQAGARPLVQAGSLSDRPAAPSSCRDGWHRRVEFPSGEFGREDCEAAGM